MILFISKFISNVTHNFTQVYKILIGTGWSSNSMCYPENQVVACGANITTESFCQNPLQLFYQKSCSYARDMHYQEQIEQCDAEYPLDTNTSKCLQNIFNCCNYEPLAPGLLTMAFLVSFAGVFFIGEIVYFIYAVEEAENRIIPLENQINTLTREAPNEEILTSLRSRPLRSL